MEHSSSDKTVDFSLDSGDLLEGLKRKKKATLIDSMCI